MNNPIISVSAGELLDRLSILKIKKEKITDPNKHFFIDIELSELDNLSQPFLSDSNINSIFEELMSANLKLWEIEDTLRQFEKFQKFDDNFIKYARLVYFTNDLRFSLKNKINTITDSSIQEQKEYCSYAEL